jgi:hypothetical protein
MSINNLSIIVIHQEGIDIKNFLNTFHGDQKSLDDKKQYLIYTDSHALSVQTENNVHTNNINERELNYSFRISHNRKIFEHALRFQLQSLNNCSIIWKHLPFSFNVIEKNFRQDLDTVDLIIFHWTNKSDYVKFLTEASILAKKIHQNNHHCGVKFIEIDTDLKDKRYAISEYQDIIKEKYPNREHISILDILHNHDPDKYDYREIVANKRHVNIYENVKKIKYIPPENSLCFEVSYYIGKNDRHDLIAEIDNIYLTIGRSFAKKVYDRYFEHLNKNIKNILTLFDQKDDVSKLNDKLDRLKNELDLMIPKSTNKEYYIIGLSLEIKDHEVNVTSKYNNWQNKQPLYDMIDYLNNTLLLVRKMIN